MWCKEAMTNLNTGDGELAEKFLRELVWYEMGLAPMEIDVKHLASLIAQVRQEQIVIDAGIAFNRDCEMNCGYDIGKQIRSQASKKKDNLTKENHEAKK